MIKDLLQEAFALKASGHCKHAIEVFYKALELDNSSSELLLEIADLYDKIGNEEKALSYIEQILDKDPTHVDALKFLKRVFEKKEAWQEAEQTAKNIYCISHNPADLAEIFKLLIKQNKFDEIFEFKFKTEDKYVCLELARAYYYKKDFTKALEILTKIQPQMSDNQDFLLLLGQCCYYSNQKDRCIEIIGQFKAKNAEQMNFLGLVETYLENYKEAVSYFNKAIKQNRLNSEYYYNVANVYFKQGELALAKRNYNLAISTCPENQNYHFALANLYYSEKHYKKALEELEGNFFEARFLKAVILYETGYLALARKELSELALEFPNKEMVNEYMTRINSELGLN